MTRRMWLNLNIEQNKMRRKKKEKLKDITINTKLSKLYYVMEYYYIFIYYL